MRRSGSTKAYRRMDLSGESPSRFSYFDGFVSGHNCAHFSIVPHFPFEVCYVCARIRVRYGMVCPNCNSADLKKVSLIRAAGLCESRGSLRGFSLDTTEGLLFGRWLGASQSLLSKRVDPPRKAPHLAPAILWLIGFFILLAFDGRGKLSWLVGVLSVGYFSLLPGYLVVSSFYNFFVCPTQYRNWEQTFVCQRCGPILAPRTGTQAWLSGSAGNRKDSWACSNGGQERTMSNVLIHKASELQAATRAALEAELGRSVGDNEDVSIMHGIPHP